MKALAVMLISAMASLLWGGEVPSAIKGTWVVKGCRSAGISALSERASKPWIGKTLVIGDKCVSLERVTNASLRFHYTLHDAETYFVEGFRVKPAAVGYKESKVREYEIMQSDGKAWVTPGSTLLILSDTEALTWWDAALRGRAPAVRRWCDTAAKPGVFGQAPGVTWVRVEGSGASGWAAGARGYGPWERLRRTRRRGSRL